MITIVEVTGYIFGYPSGGNHISSSAKGFSPLRSADLVTISNLKNVNKFAGMTTPATGSSFVKYLQQVRTDATGILPAKSVTISNLKNVNKFAGMKTPATGSSFVKYLQQVRTNAIGIPTTAKPFTISNLKNVNKFAGMKVATLGTYRPPSVFRWDFAGLNTPLISSFVFKSNIIELSNLAFSFTRNVPIVTTQWYYDTTQFKISSISVSKISSQKTLQEVFTKISFIKIDPIISMEYIQDATVFSAGSGITTLLLYSADARDLTSDYTQKLFSGIDLATILSGSTVSWKDSTGTIVEAKLIEFWS